MRDFSLSETLLFKVFNRVALVGAEKSFFRDVESVCVFFSERFRELVF